MLYSGDALLLVSSARIVHCWIWLLWFDFKAQTQKLVFMSPSACNCADLEVTQLIALELI
jgi:hypothetical protein